MGMRLLITITVVMTCLASCKVDPKIGTLLPAQPIEEIVPEGWPQPVYTFSKNILTDAGFQLGRSLFYDPMLSRDNSISCADCHQPKGAFANQDHDVSHGVDGLVGNRNSPALFNLAWHPYFMHDGGINHIEVQPLG